jgi:putative SOS response-associated peptidase YedK
MAVHFTADTHVGHLRRRGRAHQTSIRPPSFCEYDERHAKRPTWLALGEDRPLFAFAGVWRPWTGIRGTKAAPVEGEHLLYAFLTTDANAEVAPAHPKAMPVLLRTVDEIDRWLTAPSEEALELQTPLPDGTLEIVAVGRREDGPGSSLLE